MSKKKKKLITKLNKVPQRDEGSSPSHVASKSKDVFVSAGDTDPGKVRKNNEDNFIAELIWNKNCFLAAAIDGLGGYEGGEVAAQIAKDTITTYLKESKNGERIELLKQAVTMANNAIYEASLADERYSQMGCVLTSAIIDAENHLVNMAHVGDSRLYSFRNGELEKLSHDHSFVGYREEMKDLTEEQAMNHPDRNIVDRILGQQSHLASDPEFIEADTFALEPKTTFLFCSDGLTDMITSATITEILGRDCSLDEKKNALIQAALDAGGKDNVTVVLVEYLAKEGGSKSQSSETETSPKQTETEAPDEKQNDTETKPKRTLWLAVLSLFIGLLVGFVCGYGIGRHHNDAQSTLNPDASVGDTIRSSDSLLGVGAMDSVLVNEKVEIDTIKR